jgi:hypothetical protein
MSRSISIARKFYKITVLSVFYVMSILSGYPQQKVNCPPPQPFDIVYDSCLLSQHPETLFVSPADSTCTYSWNIIGDSTVFNGSRVVINFKDYGYYCVDVTATNQCGSIHKHTTVFVNPPSFCCDTVLPDDITVFPDGYVLQQGDVAYGKKYIVKGDLIVSANNDFKFDHDTLLFYPKGRLIIENASTSKGARVFANKSRFTSFCPKAMWQGIEVRGESIASNEQSQGELELHGCSVDNAHIGVLVGSRNTGRICNENPLLPLREEIYSGGGKFTADSSYFINNGIGVFYRKSDNSDSRLRHNVFFSTTLVDDNYFSGNSHHYPNVHNPWLPDSTANFSQRTYAGIYAKNIKKVMVTDKNVFRNMEYCVFTIASDVTITLNYFYNSSYGIYHIGNYKGKGHIIIANRMYDIYNFDYKGTKKTGAAIYIENSKNDLIKGSFIKAFNLQHLDNGIVLKNTTDFKIIQGNKIKNCVSAILVENGKRGYIGAMETQEIKYPAPNVLSNNRIGIELFGDNSDVTIKYNKFKASPYRFVSNIYNHATIDKNGKTRDLKLVEKYAAYNLFPKDYHSALINKDIHVFTSPFFLVDFSEKNDFFNFVESGKKENAKMKDLSTPEIIKGKKAENTLTPASLFIRSIYPNPFGKQATVLYAVPEGFDARLKIFDSKGRTIYSKEIPAGEGRMNIPARKWQSGTYLFSIYVEGELVETHKLIKQ